MKILNDKLTNSLEANDYKSFANAKPFPYVVIDNFLNEDAANKLLEEHTSVVDWNHYNHFNERKMATAQFEDFGPHTQEIVSKLQSESFLKYLSNLTGISDLLPDPNLDGGGLHRIKSGGFLNIHADYQSHPTNTHWSRELNLLLYLNKDWHDEWNGNLELWNSSMTESVVSVKPIFNRCVIFRTSSDSFHGHPVPLACPEDQYRKSLALYYFKEHADFLSVESTAYKALPSDTLPTKFMIHADSALVRAYTYLKRYSPIDDKLISRILRRF